MNVSKSPLPRFCRTVADWEWMFLALMLPFVLAATPQRAMVLLLIPLLWLVRKVGYGRFFEKTPVDWSVWGLAAMVVVSLAATNDWLASLPKVVGLLYGAAVFYTAVAYAARTPNRLWWVVGLLLMCGLLVVGIALVGVRWTSKFAQLDAIFALLPARLLELSPDEQGINPNEVAGVLLWVLPVGLALSLAILRHPRALFARLHGWAFPAVLFVWTAVLLMLAVLVLTQSRAGLLGLAAGLGMMLLVAAGRFRWWLVGVLAVLLLVGGTAVYQSEPEQVKQFLQEQAGFRLRGEAQDIESLRGREQIWERAVAGIQDFPLTGMGMNRFRVLVFVYYPTFFLNSDTDFAHAHNQFLQTGLDLGLPGLVFYIALWLGLAAMIKVMWSQTVSIWLRALATGAAGALTAYFVYGLVDAVALGAKPGFIFWLLLGIIAALYRQVMHANR